MFDAVFRVRCYQEERAMIYALARRRPDLPLGDFLRQAAVAGAREVAAQALSARPRAPGARPTKKA